MKIIAIPFILFLLLFTFDGLAQFSFGIQAGYTNAWEEYGEVELPENAEIDIDSYNASLILEYGISKFTAISLQPGLIRRGAACIPGFVDFNGESDALLSYINLPLSIQIQSPMLFGRIEPYFQAGYGLSYMVKTIERRESEDWITKEKSIILTDITENNNFKKVDHGLHSAIGINVNLGINQIRIGAEGYLGMTDAEKDNRSRNRNINLNAGILWRL